LNKLRLATTTFIRAILLVCKVTRQDGLLMERCAKEMMLEVSDFFLADCISMEA
jgi:hypothetical protein